MWMWSRHELPKQPASTDRGARIHATLRAKARRHRNLVLLTLAPALLLLLVPALATLHWTTTLATFATLSIVVVFVGRAAFRFFYNP